jgi:hypothetical protein
MHRLINSVPRVIHQREGAIHNLKKFFAFGRRKYTRVVHKDLYVNILLSKKENIPLSGRKSPRTESGGMQIK